MGKILSFKRGLGMTDKELLRAIGFDDSGLNDEYEQMMLEKISILKS